MRIDAHQHFWVHDPARDKWITDEMSVLRRDFLPEDLIRELEAHDIDGTIAVQADSSEAETQFLLDLASRYPQIRAMVGWVDLQADDVADRLGRYSQCKKLRGMRHIVQSERDDRFMVRPQFLRGIAALKEFGLTYDILIYPRQLPAALELVAKFPEQPFVIDHIAKPAIRAGQLMPWSQYIREIAQSPNVYCKISGMITEADWQHWTADDIKPYLDIVFESFGPLRVMFGSDWPVCLLAGSYGQVVELLAQYIERLSRVDKANVFGLNAARFYRL